MEAPNPRLQEAINSSRLHKVKIRKAHNSHNRHTQMFSWLIYDRNTDVVMTLNWIAENQATLQINILRRAALNVPIAGVNNVK